MAAASTSSRLAAAGRPRLGVVGVSGTAPTLPRLTSAHPERAAHLRVAGRDDHLVAAGPQAGGAQRNSTSAAAEPRGGAGQDPAPGHQPRAGARRPRTRDRAGHAPTGTAAPEPQARRKAGA